MKKKKKCTRKSASFQIMPIDGAQAFRPIGLDRTQLGLAWEKGNIVNFQNTRKRVPTFEKTEMCLIMVWQY